MRHCNWLALGLLGPATALAQSVSVVTIRIPTGTCVPSNFPSINSGNGPAPSSIPRVVTPITTSFGTYAFEGFYPIPSAGKALKERQLTVSSNGNILNGRTTTSNAMTVEFCGSFCQGSAYFALENGNECVCGTTPPAGTPVTSPGTLTPCTGNAAEVCGAPGYAVVYRLLSAISGSVTIPFTTTNAQGSVITGVTVSSVTSASTSPTVVLITTTNISGQTITTSSTSTPLTSSGSSVSPSIVSSLSTRSSVATSSTTSARTTGSSSSLVSSSQIHPLPTTSTSAGLTTNSPSTSPLSSTTSISSGPEPTILTQPVCPANNNVQFTDIFAVTYDIKCGLNVVGTLGNAAHADTFEKCLEFCDILVGCTAVTYVDPTSSTAANCIPYSSFSGYSAGAATNFYSGVSTMGASTGSLVSDDLCTTPSSPYTDIFGNSYTIGCGITMGGISDLQSTVVDNLTACLTYCSIYLTCVAVTFTGFPAPVNGANCFPRIGLGGNTPGAASSQVAYLAGVA